MASTQHEDFQPRDRGQVEDALDRDAAETSRELSARADVDPSPLEETPWEASVERGEQWTTEKKTPPER
ncbi:hypothetical protein DRW03_05760 [Corallococcus sp. H22C18031201]|uniref:hypothetical protein n=1 Tax=Citreicoccus inhibens TaxID=2849499 RepID=UPI000E762E6B|nr:hypothetical protein [Citreicoccus inhibens]MBU8896107.1 hypothetical protein [Citreicoccus inhibens]RJS25972.1 hypothetical protein DRW03_05760 [Corallococcus sp. H22C18031201]